MRVTYLFVIELSIPLYMHCAVEQNERGPRELTGIWRYRWAKQCIIYYTCSNLPILKLVFLLRLLQLGYD